MTSKGSCWPVLRLGGKCDKHGLHVVHEEQDTHGSIIARFLFYIYNPHICLRCLLVDVLAIALRPPNNSLNIIQPLDQPNPWTHGNHYGKQGVHCAPLF